VEVDLDVDAHIAVDQAVVDGDVIVLGFRGPMMDRRSAMGRGGMPGRAGDPRGAYGRDGRPFRGDQDDDRPYGYREDDDRPYGDPQNRRSAPSGRW
jgi:hypothetical protein